MSIFPKEMDEIEKWCLNTGTIAVLLQKSEISVRLYRYNLTLPTNKTVKVSLVTGGGRAVYQLQVESECYNYVSARNLLQHLNCLLFEQSYSCGLLLDPDKQTTKLSFLDSVFKEYNALCVYSKETNNYLFRDYLGMLHTIIKNEPSIYTTYQYIVYSDRRKKLFLTDKYLKRYIELVLSPKGYTSDNLAIEQQALQPMLIKHDCVVTTVSCQSVQIFESTNGIRVKLYKEVNHSKVTYKLAGLHNTETDDLLQLCKLLDQAFSEESNAVWETQVQNTDYAELHAEYTKLKQYAKTLFDIVEDSSDSKEQTMFLNITNRGYKTTLGVSNIKGLIVYSYNYTAPINMQGYTDRRLYYAELKHIADTGGDNNTNTGLKGHTHLTLTLNKWLQQNNYLGWLKCKNTYMIELSTYTCKLHLNKETDGITKYIVKDPQDRLTLYTAESETELISVLYHLDSNIGINDIEGTGLEDFNLYAKIHSITGNAKTIKETGLNTQVLELLLHLPSNRVLSLRAILTPGDSKATYTFTSDTNTKVFEKAEQTEVLDYFSRLLRGKESLSAYNTTSIGIKNVKSKMRDINNWCKLHNVEGQYLQTKNIKPNPADNVNLEVDVYILKINGHDYMLCAGKSCYAIAEHNAEKQQPTLVESQYRMLEVLDELYNSSKAGT